MVAVGGGRDLRRLGAHTMARFLAVIPVAALCLDVKQRCRIRNERVLKGECNLISIWDFLC